jgi:hypothetical protein
MLFPDCGSATSRAIPLGVDSLSAQASADRKQEYAMAATIEAAYLQASVPRHERTRNSKTIDYAT